MKIEIRSFRKVVLGFTVLAAMFGWNAVQAQTVLEEIVVVAQKRSESIQDVGVSVTAYSGDQIDRLGYTNTIQITQQTPGVSVASFHTSLANINIRGVSQTDFSEQLEAPIAIYVDDAYVSNMGLASAQMFDVERVEILRGPQGTLFGRNATGGLIHYISRRPTDEFEGNFHVTAGERGLLKLEGALGGSISDNVSGRLSFSSHSDDGYVENRIGDDLRDNGVWAVRGQLLFELGDNGELLLKAHYSEDDTNGNGYSAGASVKNPSSWGVPNSFPEDGLSRFVPNNVDVYGTCPGCDLFGYKDADNDPHVESLGSQGFTNPRGNDPFFKRDVSGVSVRFSRDFESVSLDTVTDFLSMDKSYREDSDGTPFFGALFETATELEQLSQEIRLSGEGEKLQWMTGLYYLDFDVDQFVDAPANLTFGTDAASIIPYSVAVEAVIESTSWAAFGHLEYDISDTASVIVALRYTEDERKIKDHLNYDSFGSLLPLFGVPDLTVSVNDLFPEITTQEWDNLSAKLQVNWTPTDSLLVYAAYTRGHKAGNFALPLAAYINAGFGDTSDLEGMPHDEEVLHSYEVGLKWTSDTDRLRINTSAFRYDYQDYQSFEFVGLSSKIGNIDAEIFGGEVEIVFSPVTGLEFLFGVSLLDAYAKDFQRTLLLNPSDQQLPYSPDYSFNGLIRYEWPAFNGNLAVQADFNHVDDFCFTLVCHQVEEEDSYTVGNVRISYETNDGRWTVTGFVNNFTDAEYRQYGLNLEEVTTGVNNGFAPPRWYGATVGLRF